jgi:hypothetical protein
MSFHPANHLPGCMMPDGGDCCAGHAAVVDDWHRQRREIEQLRAVAQPEQQTPIAWTNKMQLSFLKDPAYAAIPMAMWGKRSDYADIPLYAAQPPAAPIEKRECEYCKETHDIRVACPAYVEHSKKSAPVLGPPQNNAERLPTREEAGAGAGTQCSAGNEDASPTLGSSVDFLVSCAFTSVETLDPNSKHKHYKLCRCCGGTDENREHYKPSIAAVEHILDCPLARDIPIMRALSSDLPQEVQDTWLVGGPDLKAMSGSIESDRVIQLHFSRPVNDKDREWLLEAINAKIASQVTRPTLGGGK